MKNIRYVAWFLIAILATFLAYSTISDLMKPGSTSRLIGVQVGGPFTAMRTNGSVITQEEMKGRPHIMFFGFTHCPDVCPTTLYEASQWLAKLGPDGDKVDVYFVSVDPERDTAEALGEYLLAFDKRIIGVTGTREQINVMIKAWRVFAQKVPTEDSYTMNHTATTFLMDSKGEFFGTIAYGEDADTALKKIKRLLAAQ